MKFRDFLLVVGVILFLLVFTLLGNSSFSKLTGFVVGASSGSDDFLENSSELFKNETGNFSGGNESGEEFLNETGDFGEGNESEFLDESLAEENNFSEELNDSFGEGNFTLMGGEEIGEQDFEIQEGPTGYFTFQINIGSNGQTFSFVTDDVVDLLVLWGDGTNDTYSGTGTVTRSHTYATAGIYNVSLNGQASRIAFYGPSATPTLLIDVLTNMSAGLTGINSGKEMFRECAQITNFTEPAFFDDVSGNVTDLQNMFYKATNFNGDISNWDVSNVDNMQGVFAYAYVFNQPIGNWNTSSVTNMRELFYLAKNFNQSLNNWDTSKVTNMYCMFNGASSFNQPLNHWNTSSVTNMQYTFYYAISFNQSLNNWDTSKVTNMRGTFQGATNFNGNVSNWNTSSVPTMQEMFYGATAFNQPIGDWDTSKVTIIYGMFRNAKEFNQSLDKWNISGVTNMDNMFNGASSFNQPLNGWNTSSVTSMEGMFKGASKFNGNISDWNTSKVESMYAMFQSASSFNQDISSWDTSSVISLGAMFNIASSFNQPIGSWNTSSVSNFGTKFRIAGSFNQSLNEWDTSSATNMQGMFQMATSFNQDISTWNTSKVTSMSNMFYSALAFNQPIGDWDVSKVTLVNMMFLNAEEFNQPLDKWNISGVTNLGSMFQGAIKFNGNISGWDTSKATSFVSMFNGASSFNQDISHFNISSLTHAFGMLVGSNMSPLNYDKLLIGWSSQPKINPNVVLNATGIYYCMAENARNVLTGSPNSWKIEDAGYGGDELCSYGSILPELAIVFPVSDAAYVNVDEINYSVSGEDLDSCWYSLDGGQTNSSKVPAGVNFTGLGLDSGDYNLVIYCDNSLGMESSSSLSFTVGDFSRFLEMNKIVASDGEANDFLGHSVAISGDYAIVGAYGDESGKGSAYVLKKNSTGQFEDVNKILAFDGAEGDWFGWSVSISGNYAIVGAYKDEGGKGSAYVFKRNSTNDDKFELVNKINASDGSANDFFGGSVSISGDYAIVGAVGDDGSKGSAYIFKRSSTNDDKFELVSKILASDGLANDFFGYSVSISGDYAIVGACGDDSSKGSAYIFKKNSTGQFEDVNKILADDGAESDFFGYSVSISGDYAIVGAWRDDTSRGSAYIFKKNSTGRFEYVNKIVAFDRTVHDRFGHSVSISGDYAIVGAYGDDDGEDGTGSAYIFKRNSTSDDKFELMNKTLASDGAANDLFGYSVSISGDYAIVGAYGDDSSRGSAYVYNLYECVPNLTNASWGDWTNYTECLPDNNQTQVRNLTQYDSNFCGLVENQTFYEYQNVTCDYCTPSLKNTTPTGWSDLFCLESGLMNQSRSWVEYDENNCDELENVTHFEYREEGACRAGYFTFQIQTTQLNQEFSFQTDNAVNLSVLWGDGTNDTYSGTGIRSHTYTAAGIYNISLNGQTSRIAFGGTGVTPTLLIDVLTNMSAGLIGITSGSEMFRGCMGITTFTEPAFFDDVSGNVTLLNSMFYDAANFNGDISNWDTSKVTSFAHMFNGAKSFNQDIGGWNTSNVESMGYMFRTAVAFNMPIGNWDTSKVKTMQSMFDNALVFNQPLGNWNTSSVTTMENTFYYARAFNQDIDNWDTGEVTTMSNMFNNAKAFNRNIGSWDTSNVTTMSAMFHMAAAFDQPIGNWDVGRVTNMYSMFGASPVFNQDIGGWNTSSLSSSFQMFSGAGAFNQYLGDWNTSKLWDARGMFQNAKSFNEPLTNWDTGKLKRASNMFNGASSFNQDISHFNISSLTDAINMISNSNMSPLNYDKLLSNWSSQPEINPNVVFGATGIYYCAAEDARSVLNSSPNSWSILDAGYGGDELCNFCTSNITNTSWGSWTNVGECLPDDRQQQVQNLTQYDANNCGNIENQTFYRYQNISCDYCSYSVKNTSWGEYENYQCSQGEMQQIRNLTEYDENYNSCYAVTGLGSDLWNNGENKTYYDYILIGNDWKNTSWSSWDEGICQGNDLNQTRNLTQHDFYGCGTNTTFYEHNITNAVLKNTSKSEWDGGICQGNDLNQTRNWTQYDELNLGCYTNETFIEYNFTEANLTYTDYSDWENKNCFSDKMNQSRYRIQYDSKNLGCFTNVTEYEYQLVGPNYTNQTPTAWENLECLPTNFYNQTRNITSNDDYACAPSITYIEYRDNVDVCDFCTPILKNTTKGDWSNVACSLDNKMNQSKNWTEYDENYDSCYVVTGLDSDLWNNGENKTYFEYKLVGPTFQNTSWNDWTNISCLPDDKMNQSRNLTQFDIYGCAINITFFEYNATEFCDFCTPVLTNTSWGDWTNYTECLPDNNQTQVRNLTQYDSNYCNETVNQTFYEYQNVTCNYVPPVSCGDGVCSKGETCYNCPADCGYCRGGGSRIIPELIESFESL